MMGRVAAWLHRNYLSHPLLALLTMLPFLALDLWWAAADDFAAGLVIGAYFMREVVHVEKQSGEHSIPLGDRLKKYGLLYGLRGFAIWRWKRDNHLDFWPVFVEGLMIMVGF